MKSDLAYDLNSSEKFPILSRKKSSRLSNKISYNLA